MSAENHPILPCAFTECVMHMCMHTYTYVCVHDWKPPYSSYVCLKDVYTHTCMTVNHPVIHMCLQHVCVRVCLQIYHSAMCLYSVYVYVHGSKPTILYCVFTACMCTCMSANAPFFLENGSGEDL